jgi:sugar phosphate isomerase/epimerase
MHSHISRRAFLATLPIPAVLLAAKPPAITVGCQANAWPLKTGDFAQLLGVLKEMKTLGYAGFECNIRFVQDQFSRVAEARREIEKTGVKFIGAHTSMQQAKPESFPKALTSVVALGAERIVMSGTGLAPDGKFEPDALRQKCAALDAFGKTCQQHGIRLAYHNHNPEFANSNAEIEGLAKGTNPELVDFLMDAGHGYLGGGNPAEFMSQHSYRIYGCHLKTFRGKDQQVPLGQGDFDFQALAAAIQQTKWTGWIITEEGGNAKYFGTAAVGPDRTYIRKVFGV